MWDGATPVRAMAKQGLFGLKARSIILHSILMRLVATVMMLMWLMARVLTGWII